MNYTLLKLKNSPAWDDRYNLPLCPELNNPWLYCAYANIICNNSLYVPDVIGHYFRCTPSGSNVAEFYRWPERIGGETSHDEIMGVASLAYSLAIVLLQGIDEKWGFFKNVKENSWSLRHFIYRFYWLRPYLKVCAKKRINILEQFICAIYIISGAIAPSTKNVSGHLMRYLLICKMSDYKLIKLAAKLWKKRLLARSITFKSCLAIEPKEYPVLSRLAKNDWEF